MFTLPSRPTVKTDALPRVPRRKGSDMAQAMGDAATDLDDLLSILQSGVADLDGTGQRLEDMVDLTSLPTFGGEAPADTSGIWSWDETRLLVGDGTADLQIVDRADDADKSSRRPRVKATSEAYTSHWVENIDNGAATRLLANLKRSAETLQAGISMLEHIEANWGTASEDERLRMATGWSDFYDGQLIYAMEI